MCTSLHDDDPYALLGGTEEGAVVLWDIRKPGAPQFILPSVMADSSPVCGLAVATDLRDPLKRSSIFAAGDDGALRRIPARTPGAELDIATYASAVTRGAAHTVCLQADLPLRNVAVVRHEAQALEKEATVLAGSDSGAIHWACVPLLSDE
jgi:hypothetical protein